MICINLAIFAVSAFLKEATRLLALWYIGVSTALGACLGSGHFNFRGSAVGQVPSPLTPEIGQWGQATAKQKTGRMVLIAAGPLSLSTLRSTVPPPPSPPRAFEKHQRLFLAAISKASAREHQEQKANLYIFCPLPPIPLNTNTARQQPE